MKRFSLNYDLFLSGFITFIGFVGLVYLYFEKMSKGAGIGAKLFPQLSLLIILIFGAFLMVDALREKHTEAYPEINILSIALYLSLSILYVLSFTRLGMISTTFLFCLVSFNIFEMKGFASLKSHIVFSAFITFLVWVIFTIVVEINFPKGLLF